MKRLGMLVVPLRGQSPGFWCCLEGAKHQLTCYCCKGSPVSVKGNPQCCRFGTSYPGSLPYSLRKRAWVRGWLQPSMAWARLPVKRRIALETRKKKLSQCQRQQKMFSKVRNATSSPPWQASSFCWGPPKLSVQHSSSLRNDDLTIISYLRRTNRNFASGNKKSTILMEVTEL